MPLSRATCLGLILASLVNAPLGRTAEIGREVSIARHLSDGEEFNVSLRQLLQHGKSLFTAAWTEQEGGGRPFTKGTGNPISNPAAPLTFPRNFNRLSAPDANSCAGCHAQPFGIPGGGGDFVANVFVLGQRFDFLTFNPLDVTPTGGALDELGRPVSQQTVANSRATLGMFGSGYIEMLARQMTADLQAIRDQTLLDHTNALVSKGISFGSIIRRGDGTWDVSLVQGLPAVSLGTSGTNPPNLILRPFHQAGRVVSIREFSNNAFNHHHGIQTTERFGVGSDPDGDGFVNEMSRADVTAVSVFQAGLAVPGRVIPNDRAIEDAVLLSESRFQSIGCAVCHVPNLPLGDEGWVYTEPNPFNPSGNLRPDDAPALAVNLNSTKLPSPRLKSKDGVVMVPAFTDMKLHDICSDESDPNIEPLDMNQAPGSMGFFSGNRKFITRKLWGCANEPPYFHHGQYTTLRQAILAHAGEALGSRQAYSLLAASEQDAIVEFLKTLQVLPPGTRHRICDENYHRKQWPPARARHTATFDAQSLPDAP